VELEVEPEGLCYRLVGNIIVPRYVNRCRMDLMESLRWANPSAGDYKVIVVAHALDSLYDLALVVCNNLDAFESLYFRQDPSPPIHPENVQFPTGSRTSPCMPSSSASPSISTDRMFSCLCRALHHESDTPVSHCLAVIV